ncbi:hypothetical protein DL96DRAFT_1685224 [Flagelloscypha sp. PMI_526]|nr:hypothetical protein DL96DRAFT_1685224 [Flagelloscypha sp. PMI_526]
MPGGGEGLRVVSFDGPVFDFTALSELFVLESVAGTWAWDNEDFDTKGADIRVSDFCDIVGGTGIGGHKMIQDKLMLSEQWTRKDREGCKAALDAALAEIVQQLDNMVDLDDPFLSRNALKCFVSVLNVHYTGARALRNYRVRASTSPDCSIRQAIHATLSDGVHLPAVSIHDEQFLSATTGFANSSHELMKELAAAFPKASGLACFVNLGMGRPTTEPVSISEPDRLMYSTDAVAQNLLALFHDLGPCFFRLTVAPTLDSVPHKTPKEVSFVKSAAMQYLEGQDVREQMSDIVRNLMSRDPLVPLARLRSFAAEDGKAKLNAQIEAVHHDVKHLRVEADNSIFRSIRTWLTPIDQTAKLDASVRARTKSTCGWLWDHPTIIEWRKLGGLCWFHGGMGTGKTIIISHIIETLLDLQAECIVAYYYFEFTNPATLTEEALFRSLVAQLSIMSENISRKLYKRHQDGANQPQLSTLHTSLTDLVKAATLPVFVVIDALDELPSSQRKYLLATLSQLSRLTGFCVMATSRDELDIHQAFSGKVDFDFAIESEMVQHDIAVFVDQALGGKKWRSWPNAEVQRIRQTLIEKADGMFRMVACLMEVLDQTQTTEEMHHALKHLPSTLSDTYCYILDTIPVNLRARADTLLRILSVAFEPLSIPELSALLAVELGDPTDPDNLPIYREELRYHEPHNIIGLGTALVRQTVVVRDEFHDPQTLFPRVDFDDAPYKTVVLQLSHASVKEFLLYHARHQLPFNDHLAHETAARACLALLMYNENPEQSISLADTRYARFNWWSHVTPNHSVQLLSLQKEMFRTFPWTLSRAADELRLPWLSFVRLSMDFRQSPLVFAAAASLVQMLKFLLDAFQWTVTDLDLSLFTATLAGSHAEVFHTLFSRGADASSVWRGVGLLCYAAESGPVQIVELFIDKGADVNTQGGEYGSALQAAAIKGHYDIVHLLVEKGADVNMQGGHYGSALVAAAFHGKDTVAQYLIEKGADLNIQAELFGSALQLAAHVGNDTMVRSLVEKGADVNMYGGMYGTPLHEAAQLGNVTVVRYLIAKGADVNLQAGEYGSALQAAAYKGHYAVVQFLVETGADVNMQAGQYGTALVAAVVKGNDTVAQYLIERGANVNIEGRDFGSALQIAARLGNDTMVRYLIEKGADLNFSEKGAYGSAFVGIGLASSNQQLLIHGTFKKFL